VTHPSRSVVERASWRPVYVLSDVARYAGLHRSTARYWLRLIPGRELPPAASQGLCFLDLVSMLVMRELRKLGLKPDRVRHAEQYLTELFGPYPFARRALWTDGAHVFFDPDSPLRRAVADLVSADRGGQRAMMEVISPFLRTITYRDGGIAVAWRPRPTVELDPLKQIGQPCVRGTRVTTRAVYLLYKAGDSQDTIIRSFDISPVDVEAAIEWEQSLLQKAA
jgi:uncharacterized protein (DUF433 family)